ncbi:hypothetical protein [Thermococcus peptonophilus]|uniref:Uncharacterized protein n=1 Tax=Thermococcus peptonophilus TaxID=53952 RepID=A0A142CUC4_9EURY|nr:hypothetical protein [Thermococcus peptonophilus]AMQ18376.1 hypothetical protein A0127_03900 [Thermococcus peptonophilus]
MDIRKLVRTRDLLVLWKLKITRAASYLSIANSFMILFVFVKELYSVPWIAERFSFREFVGIAYALAIVGFIVLAQLDWHFMYKREQSYALTRNPLLPAQCFTTLYLLEKAVEEGRITEEEARRVIASLQLAGCDIRNAKVEAGPSGNGD